MIGSAELAAPINCYVDRLGRFIYQEHVPNVGNRIRMLIDYIPPTPAPSVSPSAAPTPAPTPAPTTNN